MTTQTTKTFPLSDVLSTITGEYVRGIREEQTVDGWKRVED
ncbi:MAG: hypothetical protein WBG19_09610 [Thermoplasmata archaeon]